jgi:hypothetical protein
MTQRQYRLDFRREECAYVFERIKASRSCSLVGIGSVGKTNLIAHIVNPLVSAHYLGQETADRVRLITIDANMLAVLHDHQHDAAWCAWSGFELLMHRLFMAFYPFAQFSESDAHAFYSAYQSLQDGRNPLFTQMALRYFELGLSLILRNGYRVVFILDEFESLLTGMPIQFFLALRGLRDSYKSSLSFITFSRAPLPALLDRFSIDSLLIEPFIELFNDYVRFIGPYNLTDAHEMLSGVAQRGERPFSEPLAMLVMEASGRYAGLMRAMWATLDAMPQYTPDHVDALIDVMVRRKAVRLECDVIWESLSSQEQDVLRAVAKQVQYTAVPESEEVVGFLLQKRLLKLEKSRTALIIEPPIFRHYVAAMRHDG